MAKDIFSWVHHLSGTCCHLLSCDTSTGCQRCSRSWGASISATVLKTPVTAGYNYHHFFDWLLPSLQACLMDWAAGSGRWGSVERLGAAFRIRVALSVGWSHHRELLFVARGMQSKKLRASLLYDSAIVQSSSGCSGSCVFMDWAHCRFAPQKRHQNPPNRMTC